MSIPGMHDRGASSLNLAFPQHPLVLVNRWSVAFFPIYTIFSSSLFTSSSISSCPYSPSRILTCWSFGCCLYSCLHSFPRLYTPIYYRKLVSCKLFHFHIYFSIYTFMSLFTSQDLYLYLSGVVSFLPASFPASLHTNRLQKTRVCNIFNFFTF